MLERARRDDLPGRSQHLLPGLLVALWRDRGNSTQVVHPVYDDEGRAERQRAQQCGRDKQPGRPRTEYGVHRAMLPAGLVNPL